MQQIAGLHYRRSNRCLTVAHFTVADFTGPTKKWLPSLPLPNFPVAQFSVAQFTVAQFTVYRIVTSRDVQIDFCSSLVQIPFEMSENVVRTFRFGYYSYLYTTYLLVE